MTYKITLNDLNNNDVHVNFVDLQKMAQFNSTTGANFDFGTDVLSVFNQITTAQTQGVPDEILQYGCRWRGRGDNRFLPTLWV